MSKEFWHAKCLVLNISNLLIIKYRKGRFIMANTATNLDRVKLLDQMLEDLAGDEFDEYGEGENGFGSAIKRFAADEVLADMDNLH